jgi:hypothetical protein
MSSFLRVGNHSDPDFLCGGELRGEPSPIVIQIASRTFGKGTANICKSISELFGESGKDGD